MPAADQNETEQKSPPNKLAIFICGILVGTAAVFLVMQSGVLNKSYETAAECIMGELWGFESEAVAKEKRIACNRGFKQKARKKTNQQRKYYKVGVLDITHNFWYSDYVLKINVKNNSAKQLERVEIFTDNDRPEKKCKLENAVLNETFFNLNFTKGSVKQFGFRPDKTTEDKFCFWAIGFDLR